MEKLREAAQILHREESHNSSQTLLIASEEIANERGFPSPSKQLQARQQQRRPSSAAQAGARINAENINRSEDDEHAVSVAVNLAPEPTKSASVDHHLSDEHTSRVVIIEPEMLTPRPELAESPPMSPARSEAGDEVRPLSLKRSGRAPRYTERSNNKSALPPRRQSDSSHTLSYKPSSQQKRDKYFQLLTQSQEQLRAVGERDDKVTHDGSEGPGMRVSSSLSKVAKMVNQQAGQLQHSLSTQSSLPQLFKSTTEEVLFRNMREARVENNVRSRGSNNSSSGSGVIPDKYIRSSVDRLSRPKSAMGTKKEFALYDDQKNCTFRPRTGQRSRGDDHGNEEDAKTKASNFIERQEASERSRVKELEFNIGKAEYDKSQDKKICPVCGSKQSYDEIKEKRKTCPNCRVEYVYKVDWNKVGNKFFNRIKEFHGKQDKNREKILKQILDGYKIKKKIFDPETNKTVEIEVNPLEKLVWTKEREADFFDRLEDYLAEKTENMKKIEEEAYGRTCTFRPALSNKKLSSSSSIGGEGDLLDESMRYGGYASDPFRAFLERYEADLERRLQAKKEMEEKRQGEVCNYKDPNVAQSSMLRK